MATSAVIQATSVPWEGLTGTTSEVIITIPNADWSATPVGPLKVINHKGVTFQYDETGALDWPPRRSSFTTSGRWKVIGWDDPVVGTTNTTWTVRIWEAVIDTLTNNLAVHMVLGVLVDQNNVQSPAQDDGTLTNSSTNDRSDTAYLYTTDGQEINGAKIGTTGKTITLAWDSTYYGGNNFSTALSSQQFSQYPVSILVDPGGPNEREVISTTVDTEPTASLDTLYTIVNLNGIIYREEDFEVTCDGAAVNGFQVGGAQATLDSYRKVGRTFIWNLGPGRPVRHTDLRGVSEIEVPVEIDDNNVATGTVVPNVSGYLVGWRVADSARAIGSNYTFTLTTADGATLVSFTAGDDNSHAAGEIAMPVLPSEILTWAFTGGQSSSSEATLSLLFSEALP